MTPRNARQEQLFDGGGAKVRRVRDGVDKSIRALRATGQIEPVDAALLALARTLADEIDDEHASADPSRFTVATLTGRLHPIITDLRGRGGTDELADYLRSLAGVADGIAP